MANKTTPDVVHKLTDTQAAALLGVAIVPCPSCQHPIVSRLFRHKGGIYDGPRWETPPVPLSPILGRAHQCQTS